MTASNLASSVTPAGADPIDAWIAAHPLTEAPDVAAAEREYAERQAALARDDAIGAYAVNRNIYEHLAAIEGRGHYEPLPPPETWSDEARRIRRRLARTYDAWRSAEREYAAGRRSSPAFAILDLDAVTARKTSPKPSRRPRLTHEQRARQRHRYKGALADALEAFARPHLRRDPRAGLLRQRWLDHRHDCHRGSCNGCARIPLPPAPRWRAGAARRRRKRDHLTVAEWLLDRAAAARGCQDVVGLQDIACGGVVVVPQSCHVRAEPDCEAARQARVVGKYRAAVTALDPARTGFLTLTKRNPERDLLAAGMADLQDAIERLKRRALWKGGRCRDRGSCADTSRKHRAACRREACPSWQPGSCRQPWDPDKRGWRIPHEPITASMATLEVTYNDERRTWHPHAHLIVEGRIDQGELADTWEQLTGDSRIVWVESVAKHAADRWAGDVEASLRELLKYAAKPHPAFLKSEDPAVVAELLVALRGRRLTTTSGRLYGLGLEDDEAESDLVLVWPEHESAERPYHAPRLCPHHNGPAAWRVMVGTLRRRDCTPAPDLSRPGRSILTYRAPAGDTLPAGAEAAPAGARPAGGSTHGATIT